MGEKILTARQLAERYAVARSTARGWFLRRLVPGAYLKETEMGSYWVVPEHALSSFTKPRPGPVPKANTNGSGKKKGREK